MMRVLVLQVLLIAFAFTGCADRCVEVTWQHAGPLEGKNLGFRLEKPARYTYVVVDGDSVQAADEWTTESWQLFDAATAGTTLSFCDTQSYGDEPQWRAYVWVSDPTDISCQTASSCVPGARDPQGEAEFTFLREGVTAVTIPLEEPSPER